MSAYFYALYTDEIQRELNKVWQSYHGGIPMITGEGTPGPPREGGRSGLQVAEKLAREGFGKEQHLN